MLLMTQLFRVASCYSLLREDFAGNKRKWETGIFDFEYAFIEEGYYHLQNRSADRCSLSKINSSLKMSDDFLVDATIELLDYNSPGHFGILWGTDKDAEIINRFTISTDGKRSLMISHEKNYSKIYSRSESKCLPKIIPGKQIRFSIVRLGVFYYFLINDKIINIINDAHFVFNGRFIGYYTEAGLSIKSKYIEVKKIKAKENESVTGLNLLLGN